MRAAAYVLDASVAVKMVIAEAGSDRARLLRRHRLIAPDLLWPECASILWKSVRRGDMDPPQAQLACAALLALPFGIFASSALMPDALRRAIAIDHPAYDCLYVALAAREALPLVTADRRLLRLSARDVTIIALDDLS